MNTATQITTNGTKIQKLTLATVAAALAGAFLLLGGGASPADAGHITCNGLPATIIGTSGNDVIYGTSGNDVINAGAGNDIVYGLGGNDAICGTEGNDTLRGGTGNDILYGGSGFDTLHGESGDDRLIVGAPMNPFESVQEVMTGGPGNDRFDSTGAMGQPDFSASPAAVTVNLTTGTATGEGTDTLVAVTRIVGSNFADFITGSSASDMLAGMGGLDIINGAGGDDWIYGGAGDDYLNGSTGTSDRCFGEAGNDAFVSCESRTQ